MWGNGIKVFLLFLFCFVFIEGLGEGRGEGGIVLHRHPCCHLFINSCTTDICWGVGGGGEGTEQTLEQREKSDIRYRTIQHWKRIPTVLSFSLSHDPPRNPPPPTPHFPKWAGGDFREYCSGRVIRGGISAEGPNASGRKVALSPGRLLCVHR